MVSHPTAHTGELGIQGESRSVRGLRRSRKGSDGHVYLQKPRHTQSRFRVWGNGLHVSRRATAKSFYKECGFQGRGQELWPVSNFHYPHNNIFLNLHFNMFS